MNTPIQFKKLLVAIFVITAILSSKSSNAYFEPLPPDTNCCDSVSMVLSPDSSYNDTCYGTVYFNLPVTSICNIVGITTNDLYSIRFNFATGQYSGNYAVGKGMNKTIHGYFVNKYGDTICSKELDVRCPSCCDSSMLYSEVDTSVTDSCAGFVYFKYDTLCSIDTIVSTLGGMNNMEWDTAHQAYRIRYQIAKGDTLDVYSYFLSQNGDTLCIRNISINCPESECCQTIGINDQFDTNPIGTPCCGTLTVDFGECDIATILVADSSSNGGQMINQVGVNTFDYCIQPGTSIKLYFYLLDANGNLVCTKVFEKYCPDHGQKMGLTNNNPNISFNIQPNPASDNLIVTAKGIEREKEIQCRIFNINGILVQSTENISSGTQTEYIIDLDSLNEGMYIIELSGNDYVFHQKILIQR